MSTTQSVQFVSESELRVSPRLAVLTLPAILVFGFALRVAAGLTQTHVLFFDETMQYFEQGHRLAFGTGVVPWEYVDGIRSWLLPGLIALVMRATAKFSDNPMLYVGAVRTLCAVLSMVVVYVGYRSGERENGPLGAIVTGGLCAVSCDLVYFSPAVMTEVLAAHCAIAALYLGECQHSTRRMFWTGALFGAAVCLRYQYAPALFLAAVWQYRRETDCWQWLFLGFTSVLLPFSGVLDAITWGAAFQSIWLNFQRNAMQGIADASGVAPLGYYASYLWVALVPLPLFLALAALGAKRFPALAIAAVATFAMHSVLHHKEVRYIYLALAAMPILIGLGTARLLRLLAERDGMRAATIGTAACLAFGALASWFVAIGPLDARWSFQRGLVHAFLAAHREPGLCGLQVRGMRSWESAGYTYLNRDVPLVFDPHVPEVHIPGLANPLRIFVEREGGPVPQLRSPFSHVIARATRPPTGFDTVSCFPNDSAPGEPELCLYRRSGGCF